MRRIAAFVFILSVLATPAYAQDDLLASCATLQPISSPPMPNGQEVPAQVTSQFRFLCGQVVNSIANVQPAFGIAFSGGAHTLGTATTIGRRLGLFPRIAVTARFNAALADVPDLLDNFNPTFDDSDPPQVTPMGTVGIPVGAFQGDVTVGLFNGISVGPMVGGLGAIDLLGSVSYVPAVEQVGLTQEIINLGVGARVGLLQQGLLMPGISVSGMYRTMLDDVSFGDIATDGDPAEFSTGLSTLSLRAAVSKGFLMFDLAAGAGYDMYSSDVAFDFLLECPDAQCDPDNNVAEPITLGTANGVAGELSTAAWNIYGNVGLSLVLLNIVGEVGYQKATDIIDAAALQEAGLPNQAPTTESLEGGRFFASIGVRLTI